jgi:glycosyltransferase involved in cell wall biosynthesis
MSLARIEPGTSIETPRNQVVVCVALDGSHDTLVRCLDSVVRHTDPEVKILICGPVDPGVLEFLEKLIGRESPSSQCALLAGDAAPGDVVGWLNTATDACAPADVALLTRACTVGAGWLEALRAVAVSDDRGATSSAMSDRGGALAVAETGVPVEWTFDAAASEIAAREPVHPRIISAAPPCVYIRRRALELVGSLDRSLPADLALIDFSQRALARGLIHLAADEVLAADLGDTRLGAGADDDGGDSWLTARYPYLEGATRGLQGERAAPLNHALASAQVALRDLRVTVDARTLTPGLNGTKLHILELVTALADSGRMRVRAIVPNDLGDYAQALARLPRLELLRLEDVTPDTPVDDVVHRPHQVSSVSDLDLFEALGRRLVITQQDLINFHNPAYFSSGEDWEAHRRLTRTALALADRVVFFSDHVANDARLDGLIEDRRGCVVPIGIDHRVIQLAAEPSRPAGAESLEGAEFLVCLGADLEHKNRAFAIDLFGALRDRHGWSGRLVLAGPAVRHGSSAAQEIQARLSDPDLAGSVLSLGSVDEAGKSWLLRSATAVVYPSVVEGFGLVPFEAAAAGVPCLFASGTALAESLPSEAGSIVPWNAADSADRVIALLRDQDTRTAHLEMVRQAGARYTWRETAGALLGVYRDAVRGPGSQGQAIAAEALERERRLAACGEEIAALRELVEDHERRWSGLGEDALRLVGPHGTIPVEIQRPLLAVSTRRALRGLLFAVLKAGYSLGARHRD